MLGQAIAAVVQLSIVVRGIVDGEEQLIWYAVGSGTVVAPDGLILTNHHLITPAGIDEKLAELETQLASEGKSADLQVDPERFMVAISDGRHLPDPRYLARVVAEDPDLDLAVLRIDSDERGTPLDPETLDLPILPLGSSDAVNLGETVHVFGFPAIGSWFADLHDRHRQRVPVRGGNRRHRLDQYRCRDLRRELRWRRGQRRGSADRRADVWLGARLPGGRYEPRWGCRVRTMSAACRPAAR